jgi:hypothetical protein
MKVPGREMPAARIPPGAPSGHAYESPEGVLSAPGEQLALFLALVLTVTFVAYLDTLWFQFVHDDEYQILGNAFLRSWSYLPRYFTSDVWAFRYPNAPGNFYRPLFLLWMRLNYVLFGLRPWGWHLTTLLAHLGATFFVYALVRTLLADGVAALFAALVFGLHPIHIEAVAWVSGVPEPLLALFLLPSFLCHLRARNHPGSSRAWLAASLILYALAMLVKETAIVLPLIIFAREWLWFDAKGNAGPHTWLRRFRVSLGCVSPYLALMVPYFITRVIALKGFSNPNANLPLATIVGTWPSLLLLYIQHLVWPVNLNPVYDLEYVVHPSLHNVVIPGAVVVLTALLLGWWSKRSRMAAMASVWLVVPILPVLQVQVFGNGQFAHDRYLYLPSVGFAMLTALAIRTMKLGRVQLLGQPAVQVALVLVLACALGTGTTSQNVFYADHKVFYAHCHAGAPNNDLVKINQAGLLGEDGKLFEAVGLYREVLERHPNWGAANYDLGYAYYLLGNLQGAERYLTRATQLDPGRPGGYFYLGLTKLKMGRVDEAANSLRQALSISPETDNYHFALGVVLKLQGDLHGALTEFRAELALDPHHAAASKQIAEIQAQLLQQKDSGTSGAP